MPKKTKAQKIIATYRKKLYSLESSPNKLSSIENKIEPIKEKNITPKIISLTNEDLILKKYFTGDLLKSFLLIFFILSFELVLYFVSINK